MTAFDAQLLLHLPLDALPGGQATDTSSSARHGTVAGAPAVVADDTFGSSVRFHGPDSVSVADVTPRAGGTNPVLSVTGWVLLDAYPGRRSWLLTLGQVGAGSLHWLVEPDGSTQLGVWQGGQVYPTLPLGTWVHVATTYDGTTLRGYLNGRPAGAAAATFDFTSWTFELGKPRLGEAGYVGRLAGLRVYQRALSEDDLKAVIDDDLSAMAAFRRSHPLSFDLHDPDDQPVLAIVDDPTGQAMALDVTNDASRVIVLNPIDPAADKSHLELAFRPGILPADRLAALAVDAPPGWTSRVRTGLDGTVAIALTSTVTRAIQASETIHFGLRNIAADPRGGSRGTRVQLGYDQMSYQDDPAALTGSRLRYLNVVNRRGQRQIPLDLGFIGYNTVLSDARSTSKLRLRIVNVSDTPVPLVPSGQTGPSAFIVSFDVQLPDRPVDEWALCRPDDLASIDVAADGWVAAPATEEGQTLTWRLTTPTLIAIEPHDDVHVTLDGLIGLPPSGHTTIHVRYENIPGYWDGYLSAVVEKGPLIRQDVQLPDGSTDTWVGVGTADPKAKLQVVGGAIMPAVGHGPNAGIQFPSDPGGGAGDAAWIRYYPVIGESTTLEIGIANDADDHIALMPSGNVGVNTKLPDARLHVVHQPQHPRDGAALMVGPVDSPSLRLGYDQQYAWLQTQGHTPLSINPLGNQVGVGTAAPEAALDVARGPDPNGTTATFRGSWAHSQFNHGPDEHTYLRGGLLRSNVIINDTGGGGVAIGAADPGGNMLLVNGAAKVKRLSVDSSFQFLRMQAGRLNAGDHNGGVKQVRIDFREPFRFDPHVVVTPRNQSPFLDVFAVTLSLVEPAGCVVSILRLDAPKVGWDQDLQLDWIAWE
jgi:hypothetical protein